MSKQAVKLKGVLNREQAAVYLEDLAASLKEGKVCVQQDDQFVTLCPEALINVKVEASSKKDKEKFEMELSWRKVEPPKEMAEVKITSSEPEPSPAAAKGVPAVSGPAIEVQSAASAGVEDKASATGEVEPESGEEKTKPGKKTK